MKDLRYAFPDALTLRKTADEWCLYDPKHSMVCGFASNAEAEILHNWAAHYPGPWLEIGSYVGWTAAHILIADPRNTLVMVDQDYGEGVVWPKGIQRSAMKNLGAVPIDKDRYSMVGMSSKDYFASLDSETYDPSNRRFVGCFIDGCHDFPVPYEDAVAAELHTESIIVFHDFRGQPIKDGVNYLRNLGWEVHQYDTINGLAVCLRPETNDE